MAGVRGKQDVTKLEAKDKSREANENWKEHVEKERKLKKMNRRLIN